MRLRKHPNIASSYLHIRHVIVSPSTIIAGWRALVAPGSGSCPHQRCQGGGSPSMDIPRSMSEPHQTLKTTTNTVSDELENEQRDFRSTQFLFTGCLKMCERGEILFVSSRFTWWIPCLWWLELCFCTFVSLSNWLPIGWTVLIPGYLLFLKDLTNILYVYRNCSCCFFKWLYFY